MSDFLPLFGIDEREDNDTDQDQRRQLSRSLACQFLVCADLCTYGIIAYPGAEQLSYDVVIDLDGLHKVQVKILSKYLHDSEPKYVVRLIKQRDKRRSNYNQKYSLEEARYFAFVELEKKLVVYIKNNENLSGHLYFRQAGINKEYCDLSREHTFGTTTNN